MPMDRARAGGSMGTAPGTSDWVTGDSLLADLRSSGSAGPSRKALGNEKGRRVAPLDSHQSCGAWIRTKDLRVMSPTSCRCSTPRLGLYRRNSRSSGKPHGVGLGDGGAVIRYTLSPGLVYPLMRASSSSAEPLEMAWMSLR